MFFSLAFLGFESCPCFVAAICNYCMFMYHCVHLPRRNVLFKWNSFKPVLAALILFQLTHMSNVHEVYGCFVGPATTFAWIQSALLKPYDHLGLQIWFAASHLKLSNIYLMLRFKRTAATSYTPRKRSYLVVTSPTSLLSSLPTYEDYDDIFMQLKFWFFASQPLKLKCSTGSQASSVIGYLSWDEALSMRLGSLRCRSL